VNANDAPGNAAENPPEFVDPELMDGVVLDASLVEDDDSLSLGSEIWEYDIADGRNQELEDALKNSQMVMEYEVLDDSGQLDEPQRVASYL
jgi:hypothetical protein